MRCARSMFYVKKNLAYIIINAWIAATFHLSLTIMLCRHWTAVILAVTIVVVVAGLAFTGSGLTSGPENHLSCYTIERTFVGRVSPSSTSVSSHFRS